MKRAGLVLMMLLFCGVALGQWSGYYGKGEGELDGGLGMAWIDNQPYFSVSFMPDISIGKIGIGLNINLLVNTQTGKVRSADWDSGYDYARLIRYLRYAHKGDPFYARLGALDATRLGHGFIVNYYNNQINYDERKIGLALDVDRGLFGFETIASNLGRLEVAGIRAYVRPLYKSEMPILKNLGFGASYVTDADPDAWKKSEDGISLYGVDVELPLIKSTSFNTMLYADHAAVLDPPTETDMMTELLKLAGMSTVGDWDKEGAGSGQAIGIRMDFNALLSLVNLSAQFERRMLNKGFIPGYFGPFYEVLRYTSVGELLEFYEELGGNTDEIKDNAVLYNAIKGVPVRQKMLLPLINQDRKGWFGGLTLDVLKFVRVLGTYQLIDGQANSGLLHFGAGLSQDIPLVSFEATYDKIGMDKLKDVFKLDRRAVARVGLGYKIKPYLLLYVDYIWNFVWDEDKGAYKPQERIQPRLALRYPLDLQ